MPDPEGGPGPDHDVRSPPGPRARGGGRGRPGGWALRRVEQPIQRARDVPGTLDHRADRQALPEEPVQAGDVGPHVAAHQDRAACRRRVRWPELLLPADLEAAEHRRVRADVEGIVASQEEAALAASSGQSAVDRAVQLRARARRSGGPRSAWLSAPARVSPGPPQAAQQGGAPRRAQEVEHGHEELENDELPAEDPADEPIQRS